MALGEPAERHHHFHIHHSLHIQSNLKSFRRLIITYYYYFVLLLLLLIITYYYSHGPIHHRAYIRAELLSALASAAYF